MRALTGSLGTRRRLRTGFVLLAGQGLGRGALAAYTVLMVRELSRSDYGDLAYLIAVAGIFVALGDLGFSRVMVRDIARSDRPIALAREMLRVRSLGVVAAVAVFLMAGLAGVLPGAATVVLAAGAFLLAEGLAYGYESVAVASERPGPFAGVQAVGAVAVAVAAVVLLARPSVSPAGAMAGLAAASTVKLAAHVLTWTRRSVRLRPWREMEARRWLGDALPFLFLAALAAVYYRVGVVILHGVRGAEQTAPYAASMRVFDGIAVIGGAGFAVVGPALSRAHRDRPGELWALWRRMIAVAAVVVVPGAAVLALFAHALAGALFGGEYRDSAGDVLVILAPGMAIAILQNLSAAVIFMADERGAVLRLTTVNVLVLVVALFAGAQWHGATGAAAAMSMAEVLSFVSFALLVRRRYGAPPPAPA